MTASSPSIIVSPHDNSKHGSLDDFARKLKTHLLSTTRPWFDFARTLQDAKGTLSESDFGALSKTLDLDDSTVSKFITIAECDALHAYEDRLACVKGYTALYEIALVAKDKALFSLFVEKFIDAAEGPCVIRRVDVEDFRKEHDQTARARNVEENDETARHNNRAHRRHSDAKSAKRDGTHDEPSDRDTRTGTASATTDGVPHSTALDAFLIVRVDLQTVLSINDLRAFVTAAADIENKLQGKCVIEWPHGRPDVPAFDVVSPQ